MDFVVTRSPTIHKHGAVNRPPALSGGAPRGTISAVTDSNEAAARLEPEPYVPPVPVAAVLLFAALAAAIAFSAKGIAEVARGPEELSRTLLDVRSRGGRPVDFELGTLDGEKIALSELGDQTVFLNFWATWCPPCVEEMPSLRRLHAKLKDHPDFEFLAVSTDEAWADVRRFFEREGAASFPVLLDAEGRVARKYGTEKFPETYVIQDGELVGHIIGPRDWDHWYAEAWLRELLEGRS